ncbi:hypothetical protein Sjap_022972 [Stephania japonica]|uniref:Zinc finger PMZ-type domain-containing protein n=1 Tax=Stephania japonica TaxID=461633 RepID=A0AAP0ESG7_9MAGN
MDMKARTCLCREWNLIGIPCPHSICTIYHQSKALEDFVAHWYHKEKYLKAYKHIMGVVAWKNFWPKRQMVLELSHLYSRKCPGDQKESTQNKDEPQKVKDNKLLREGRIMTCRICKSKGHNKRTCPFRADEVEVS